MRGVGGVGAGGCVVLVLGRAEASTEGAFQGTEALVEEHEFGLGGVGGWGERRGGVREGWGEWVVGSGWRVRRGEGSEWWVRGG